MTKLFKIGSFSFAILALMLTSIGAQAQTALTSTTLSAAITVNQTLFTVASATGITGNYTGTGTLLYVIDKPGGVGELMQVTSVNSTTLTANRLGPNKKAHANGAIVLISAAGLRAQSFQSYNPSGACTAASTLITPWVNTATGEEWLCSTVTLTWVPGWNNAASKGVSAAVASAAGQITPSGPKFHVTGTAAITGFVLPIGFAGGHMCIIPDGAFTTTTANNIAIASTAVVGRALCYEYDGIAAKFYPPY